jgi:hypothetical protein
MRAAAVAAVALSVAAFGLARAQNTVVVPPPPPIVSAPLASPPAQPPAAPVPPPPGLVQTPFPPASSAPPAGTPPAAPPANATPAAPSAGGAPAAGAAPAAPAPPDVAPVLPNDWTQGKTATLGVLDKVDGSVAQISIPVGGQQNVGDLQVSVQACVVRPPGELPDAAIYLTVQNASDNADAPLYRGWMVRSEPGATAVGDASETFRVIGCS